VRLEETRRQGVLRKVNARLLATLTLCVLLSVVLTGCATTGGSTTPGQQPPPTTPHVANGLTATAGNAQVSLAWAADSGATTYHVKRGTVSGGPYTQIAAPTSTTDIDTGLTNGTKYFYVVSAANSAGESGNSAEVNATPAAPVTIPNAPSGLSATAGNAQVTLAWNASNGATSYHLKRATVSGGPYTQIAAPTAGNFADTGLSNGTKYFYVVSAINSAGESANSAEATATPVAPVSVPAVPAGLAATAGNAQVALAWAASTGATSYHLKRATVSGGPYTQIAAPAATNFTDTGLTNGTKYFYVVSAVNSAGESANSAQASATPVAPVVIPSVPTGLVAIAGNGQVSLSWSASSGATGYHLKRATASGGPYTQIAAPTTTSFTDSGLTNGTKYFYVVSALNSAGESANSTEVNAAPVAPVTVPAAPTGLAAAAGNAQINLTWSTTTGATSYHLKRATVSGGPYTQIAVPTSPNFTDTGLTNGTKYFYVVSALNSAGESANSAQVNATPVAPVVIAVIPSGVAATAGNAQVSLSWNASSGATSYHVKRGTMSGGPYTQVGAPTAASFTDTTASNGTKYFYVVSAVNSAGESGNSAELNATPTAPVTTPAVPGGLQASAGNAQVVLTWNTVNGASSYHVKRATVSGGPYTQIAAPASATFTDTGLANGTTYFYVVSALNSAGESGNSAPASATPTAPATADVTITIDPTNTKPISPYVYGTNFYSGNTDAPKLLTFDRDGGDRWTAYNWETNASNAGSDFLYESDDFLSSSNVPAEAVRSFIAGDQANGLASLVTFQLQGLVSADEAGPVSVANPPDLSRFKTVVDKKSTVSTAPFTLTPPTSDASVYMDEFAWALDQKFAGEGIFGNNPTHPTFIDLDNEPELWNTTHLEVQGSSGVDPNVYITKTIALAEALKDQFPDALIFGPVHYGFEGIYSWQGALNPTPNGANWFPDKYLPAIKAASATYGKPVVDVYDFHWYAEDYDSNGTRILDLTSSTLTDAQVQLIVQSPRNLWDSTWNDAGNSNPWIYETLGNTPINILGRLQAKINTENPGMKLAITEYESGGFNHIAGTIAQADNLGIFGTQGIFAANFWPPNGTYSYTLAGFRAFRGFDGANAVFGDTSLSTTSSNVGNVVVYASLDSATPGRVVFVAINRSTASQVTAINGQAVSGTAHLYQITAASAATQVSGGGPVAPVAAGTMAVSGNSFTVTLPALSVTTIDVN
jgi:fibronectin type 3 domain-containing protein